MYYKQLRRVLSKYSSYAQAHAAVIDHAIVKNQMSIVVSL